MSSKSSVLDDIVWEAPLSMTARMVVGSCNGWGCMGDGTYVVEEIKWFEGIFTSLRKDTFLDDFVTFRHTTGVRGIE